MKGSRKLVLIPVLAAVCFVAATAFFYQGRYTPPHAPVTPPAQLALPSYTDREFSESPVSRQGILLVDMAHGNDFDEWELSVLISRVAARGFTVEYTDKSWSFPDDAAREAQMEEKLRPAAAYLVAVPWSEFSPREKELARGFVGRGGRLLLVGDATRRSQINGLASVFGITFESDYLYNIREHDINYQNIFLRDFQPDELTRGLGRIALYTAGSISSRGKGLVFSDENTFSSLREGRGRFMAAVRAGEGKVVAISDLTFMVPPYNASADNDRFISNIADFLTTSQRLYYLADFPHFFSGSVDVVAASNALLPAAQSLKASLATASHPVEIREREDFLRDTVFLGLWPDTPRVEHYLGTGGIRIDETIRTLQTPEVDKKDTSLSYLYESQGRRFLIILADTEANLVATVKQLQSGEFRNGVLSDRLGIYHFQPEEGRKTPTPRPTATREAR